MRYCCLLRGINVGGKRSIQMAALRAFFCAYGFKNVATYLQSGNVFFDTDEPIAQVSDRVAALIASEYGYSDIDVMVLGRHELASILNTNPFSATQYDAAKLYVTFLKDMPDPGRMDMLMSCGPFDERFVFGDKAIYLYCPNGYGRSKVNNAFFEKELQVRATTRNWKTTCQLYHMTAPDQ